MVKEFLITEALCNLQLMRIPQFSEDLLDVMLVHAKVHKMDLSTLLADKGAVGDIAVRCLSLLTIDAVSVELVISH